MFGNKRLAKRSIIGTRVSALRSQDGRFYPAIIQAQISEDTISSGAVYAVRFDDGLSQHVKSRNIVGQGFYSITSAALRAGQKIYITLNGREVSGTVSHHDRDMDEVRLNVKTPSGDDFSTICRLEDVRLLESRKSARLESHQDTDYSKLADLHPSSESNKKRIASHVIDVPSASLDKNDRQRRQRHLSDERAESENGGDFDDVEMMDETIAAMVLTSLSVSPKSPTMMAHLGNREYPSESHVSMPYPDTHLSSSVASSGFYSGPSERDDHSPPLPPLSESAPALMGGYKPPTPGSDDDSSSSSGRLLICEEEEEDEDEHGAPIQYRCTWRGCDVMSRSSNKMERHIRRVHFDRDSDLEMTDNEEEFHYTEVDEAFHSISNMTQSFAAMKTSTSLEERGAAPQRHRHVSEDIRSSSGQQALIPAAQPIVGVGSAEQGRNVFDHDYQRKMSRQQQQVVSHAEPERPVQQHASSLPITINQAQIQKSLSWQIHSPSPSSMVSPPTRQPKLTPQERLYQHQAQSPKSSVSPSLKITQHRRPRSEVRKCRKVYGMDHRDQWCTQCKWKKACTRFID